MGILHCWYSYILRIKGEFTCCINLLLFISDSIMFMFMTIFFYELIILSHRLSNVHSSFLKLLLGVEVFITKIIQFMSLDLDYFFLFLFWIDYYVDFLYFYICYVDDWSDFKLVLLHFFLLWILMLMVFVEKVDK